VGSPVNGLVGMVVVAGLLHGGRQVSQGPSQAQHHCRPVLVAFMA
jgi:hypothetical protein